MKLFQSFTRGGQLAVHQYRMLKQICIVTVVLSLCMGMGFGAWVFLEETTPYQRYLSAEYVWAEFKINIHFNQNRRMTQKLKDPDGKLYIVDSASILNNSWILSHVEALDLAVKRSFTISLWSAFLSALLSMFIFVRRGYRSSRKKLERGGVILQSEKCHWYSKIPT